MNIDPKFVVELQGKQFITYDGLLSLAHSIGLVEITTELVRHDNEITIFRATARTGDQKFDGYGDATDANVNRMIAKHRLRMAETRAKARALRDLTNVGMVAVEELGGDDVPKKDGKKQEKSESWQVARNELIKLAKDSGIEGKMPGIIKEKYGASKTDEMTEEQLQDCIRYVAQEAFANA